MALNQVMTGPQNQSDSTVISARAGKQGDTIVSELHGRYYEQTYRGKIFHAATQALVTTTVGLATTYTGLVLSNPVGSGINLEIITASMMQSVLQATQVEAFAIATGSNSTTNVTHTTPVAPKSSLIGSGLSGVALADVSATLPTAPVYSLFLTNTGTATADSTGVQAFDVSGQFVIAPGGYILFATPAQASVAGMWFSLSWAEAPV